MHFFAIFWHLVKFPVCILLNNSRLRLKNTDGKIYIINNSFDNKKAFFDTTCSAPS